MSSNASSSQGLNYARLAVIIILVHDFFLLHIYVLKNRQRLQKAPDMQRCPLYVPEQVDVNVSEATGTISTSVHTCTC